MSDDILLEMAASDGKRKLIRIPLRLLATDGQRSSGV